MNKNTLFLIFSCSHDFFFLKKKNYEEELLIINSSIIPLYAEDNIKGVNSFAAHTEGGHGVGDPAPPSGPDLWPPVTRGAWPNLWLGLVTGDCCPNAP